MIALVACSGRASYSLAGEWDWTDGHSEFPKVCGSDGTVQYHLDGSYTLWGEAGKWRLDSDALTEAMTGFDSLHVDRPAEDIGKAYVSTIKWVDQNTFLKRRADGSELAFRRCPSQK
jgi:hypothetical protein